MFGVWKGTVMRIAVGADHAGVQLKAEIAEALRRAGHAVDDVGTFGAESVDYPKFAGDVAQRVASGAADRGVLICGTGIGMSIAVNRYRAVRAALVSDAWSARMSRLHNDANVLCLGARVVGAGVALDIVEVWVNTAFEGGRHQRRVDMLRAVGAEEPS